MLTLCGAVALMLIFANSSIASITIACTPDNSDSGSAPESVTYYDTSTSGSYMDVWFEDGNVYFWTTSGTPTTTTCPTVSATASEYPGDVYYSRPELIMIVTGTGDDTVDVFTADDHGAAGFDTWVSVSTGDGDDDIRTPTNPATGEWPDAVHISGGGGRDNDTIYGGESDDYLADSSGTNTFYGSGGDDQIEAGQDVDTISGGDGDDTLDGGASNDVMNGGDGDDTLGGSSGIDTLHGDDGDDRIEPGPGGSSDRYDGIYGDEGNDTVAYDRSSSVTLSNNGHLDDGASDEFDLIETTVENVEAGSAADSITWNFEHNLGASNTINAGAGDDTINVQNDGDTVGDDVDCDSGTDTLYYDTLDTYLSCESLITTPTVTNTNVTPTPEITPLGVATPAPESPAPPSDGGGGGGGTTASKTKITWSGVSTVKLKKKKVSAYLKATGSATGTVTASLIIGSHTTRLGRTTASVSTKKKKFTASFKKYKKKIAGALRKKKTKKRTYVVFSFSGKDGSTTKKVRIKRK